MVVNIIIVDLDWSRIGMNAHSSRHQTWGSSRFDGAFSTPHSSRDDMKCVHSWRTESAMKAYWGRPRFLVWQGYFWDCINIQIHETSLWPNESGVGLLACFEVWVCGRSWVRAPAGAIVRRVFHPTRTLVRFSLLKCPSVPNSKKFW